jgi:hypothetical protein
VRSLTAGPAALCCLLALAGCAKKPPELTKLERERPAADMTLKLGAVFGGALELIGGKVVTPPQGVKPSSRVEVTLYWRKVGAVPSGYRLFTHLLDEAGERVLNLDNMGLLRKTEVGEPLYPPSLWEEGKVYEDSFAFFVPPSVRTDTIRLVCGVYRGSERLPLAGKTGIEATRATVTKLSVTRPPLSPNTPVPVLWVQPLRSAVTVDGKLDEDAWAHAATTGPLVNVGSGEPASLTEVTGRVKLLYDAQALYVGFDVIDEDLRGGFDPHAPDPHLWTKDTVELMIDPDGDGDNRDYYEIQVGPQNLVFDSQFDSYNQPRVEPNGPFGHQEWSSQLTSAVTLRGTLDDDKEDEGYTVELSIPWSSFARAKRVPPAPTDSWRMNFYVVQNNAGAAWSPILGQGNFHKATRFGRVRFSAMPKAKP